jgi:hypothetical protein
MTDPEGNPIVSQEALALRDGLIERMSVLPPVNGLLDQINWHFGHHQVAEITGRSQRIILEDGRYQLAERPGASNLAETAAFQSGEKRVLIFDEYLPQSTLSSQNRPPKSVIRRLRAPDSGANRPS